MILCNILIKKLQKNQWVPDLVFSLETFQYLGPFGATERFLTWDLMEKNWDKA